eukprot:4181613-Pyramimonas_sp.AAC.1
MKAGPIRPLRRSTGPALRPLKLKNILARLRPGPRWDGMSPGPRINAPPPAALVSRNFQGLPRHDRAPAAS